MYVNTIFYRLYTACGLEPKSDLKKKKKRVDAAAVEVGNNKRYYIILYTRLVGSWGK